LRNAKSGIDGEACPGFRFTQFGLRLLRTLYESGAIENSIEGADRRLVSEIFSAMIGAMRASQLKVHEGLLLS
jgi:hypothetical protein